MSWIYLRDTLNFGFSQNTIYLNISRPKLLKHDSFKVPTQNEDRKSLQNGLQADITHNEFKLVCSC